MAKAVKKYDASSITWLEGLEGLRAKPSMYLGKQADSAGVLQLALEILGNALDEANNGNGDTVGIKVEGDTITVFDTGRGIPFGPHPKHKNEDTLTILATKLHAGGKLSATDGNYGVSLGTHGVGLSVTNALSSKLTIWSKRDGKIKSQTFSEGKPTSKVVDEKPARLPKFGGKAWPMKTGTIVQWTWDKKVFDKGSKLDEQVLLQTVRDMSWFAAYITKAKRRPTRFLLEDSKGKVSEVHRKSLAKYVDNQLSLLNKGRKEPLLLMEETRMEGFDAEHDFVGAWVSSSDDLFTSAVNSLMTKGGGTHHTGASMAMYDAFRKIANKKQPFRVQDLLTGFVGCINIRIPSPTFDGQGKGQLVSLNGKSIAYDAVFKTVSTWIRKNKATALKIIERAVSIHSISNDQKLNKQLASALQIKKGGKSMLPAQLIQSTTRNPMERELFLIEGKSAGGTAKKASDRKYQEALPLRGKLLNVEKAANEKMSESQVIIDLLRSIEYDPRNPEKPLRVGKIMILSDPDPDGPLHRDTLIPFINMNGKEDVATIGELAELYKSVDKPIRVFSYTKNGKVQEANAILVNVREYSTTSYVISFTDGTSVICTESHQWLMVKAAKSRKYVYSSITGQPYLKTTLIQAGDRVAAINTEGYVTVASVTPQSGTYDEYYCMTVPLFGNFLVNLPKADGTYSQVVSSNCHINSLILTLLWNTVPYMFEQGRIYLVNAPLFTYATPKRKYYGDSLKDLMQKVGGKLDPARITRVKGYAEMSPTTLKEVAFDPETRNIVQVTHPGDLNSMVRRIMGDDQTIRKQMLGLD